MNGIHKILVPVDFSMCSTRALEHAVELSERYFGASIDVLHVWDVPPSSSKEATERARVDVMNSLERLLEGAETRGVVEIRRLHEAGEPVKTILEAAARGYDLVILGTHGRTGLTHDYLGSVAEKVVRRAPCPVLTFRNVHTATVARPAAAAMNEMKK